MQLAGKHALVTGASRGIGRAVALGLAARGCRLTLVARDRSALEAVGAEIESLGQSAVVRPADLADPNEPARLAADVLAGGDVPNILVNNAAVLVLAELVDMTDESIREQLHVNLVAPIALTRALLGEMRARGDGAIVNLLSSAGLGAGPFSSGYAASKWGLNGFTECLRFELRDSGIRVLSAYPPLVDTEMGRLDPDAIALALRRSRLRRTAAGTSGRRRFPPDEFVASVVHALERDRPDVLYGGWRWRFAWLAQIWMGIRVPPRFAVCAPARSIDPDAIALAAAPIPSFRAQPAPYWIRGRNVHLDRIRPRLDSGVRPGMTVVYRSRPTHRRPVRAVREPPLPRIAATTYQSFRAERNLMARPVRRRRPCWRPMRRTHLAAPGTSEEHRRSICLGHPRPRARGLRGKLALIRYGTLRPTTAGREEFNP